MEPDARLVVRTVQGDVDASDVGMTLCHEHLAIDVSEVFGDPDLKLDDPDMVAEDLAEAVDLGLRTVVDVTPCATGRDPKALVRIAGLAKLHVVAAAGYHFAGFLPSYVDSLEELALAERIRQEIEEGIEGTGIRAGVIGEVGNATGGIAEVERKVLRASGRAQRGTGACVITHTDYGRFGPEQLDLLEDGGADLSRVLVGHMDCTDDLGAHLAIAERGAFVGFDRIGAVRGVFGPYQTDEVRVESILRLLERGYASQVILSHDVCRRSRLRRNGGSGYGHIQRTFVPMLRRAGVDDATIQLLLVGNPRRLLAFSPRR